MKKIFISLMALSAMQHSTVNACNVCGCSSGNQYIGLLPQNNNSFIGFQYLYRSFRSVHLEDGGSIVPGTSYESYQTMQLWGRISLSNRLQLIGFIPFVQNTQRQEGQPTSVISGIGDVSLVANYKFVDGGNCAWRHRLWAGGGVKAPTGKYDPNSVATDEGLPNMQPGTHSWDFIGNVNYTARHRNAGVNLDVSYVATTANSDNYKFGNRLSAGASAFYEVKHKDFTVLPQLGLRHDLAAKDYEDYRAGIKDEDGGGWQLYASQGVQAYYRHVGLQAMCYEPIQQHYASGNVNSKFRFEAGVVVMIK